MVTLRNDWLDIEMRIIARKQTPEMVQSHFWERKSHPWDKE
jgi:hypothetical protein